MILSRLNWRTCAAVLAAFAFCLTLPSTASAQVVLTFVAKRGAEALDFPHSMLRITGTTESGEAIDRNFGFMPKDDSLTMMLGGRVSGAVIDRPEASIPWELVTPHISVQIPDSMLDAVIVRFRYWNENQNGGYDFFDQNCIAFLADIAGTVGLKVPPGAHLSPGGFMRELAEMNPPGSFPGILPSPVPNPEPLDPTAEAPVDAAAPTVPEPEATSPDPAPAEPQPTPN